MSRAQYHFPAKHIPAYRQRHSWAVSTFPAVFGMTFGMKDPKYLAAISHAVSLELLGRWLSKGSWRSTLS